MSIPAQPERHDSFFHEAPADGGGRSPHGRQGTCGQSRPRSRQGSAAERQPHPGTGPLPRSSPAPRFRWRQPEVPQRPRAASCRPPRHAGGVRLEWGQATAPRGPPPHVLSSVHPCQLPKCLPLSSTTHALFASLPQPESPRAGCVCDGTPRVLDPALFGQSLWSRPGSSPPWSLCLSNLHGQGPRVTHPRRGLHKRNVSEVTCICPT